MDLVDKYIDKFPSETQKVLQKVREIVKKIAPNSTQVISYGIPAFKLNGTILVFFAGWKNHISLYPIPQTSESFQKKIKRYIAGKGTIKFTLNKPIPYLLIKEFVKFSLKANLRRTALKKAKV